MSNSVRGQKVIDLRKWHANNATRALARAPRIEPEQSRKSPLRARRRKLRALAALVLLALIAGAVQGLSILSYLPMFAINNVSIVGAKEVSPKILRAYVETTLHDGSRPLLSRTNIFLYSRDDIGKSITERFPRIRSVAVSRESFLAQAIVASVAEREPFALWCSAKEECYLMDEGGFIFAPSSTSSPAMVFRGGLASTTEAASSPIGQTFLPTHLASVIEMFKRLREAGYAPNGATVLDGRDFYLSFSEGFILRASFGSDASSLVRNFQLALSAEPILGKVNELDYVDMRFGNRVYYKFKK